MSAPAFEQTILPLFETTNGDWIDDAGRAAEALGRNGAMVTIDDVRGVCPPPAGTDARIMGAVFSKKLGWECVGYRRSTRADCHGRPVAIWRKAP